MSVKTQIDLERLPQHIAIIMDGNGRWAKKKGKVRLFGHENGVKSVREVSEGCAELGVKYLTLFAFSSENWNRPKLEVQTLTNLLVKTIKKEIDTLQKNNIKLNTIGDISKFGNNSHQNLLDAMEKTKNNDRMTLTLALNYSGRWDLNQAFKKIMTKCNQGELDVEDVTEQLIQENLDTGNIPEPDLLIRTSGEYRISNFLLFQAAYSELYFTPTLWPDFNKEDLYKAIIDFQNRERRFGLTSEQIK